MSEVAKIMIIAGIVLVTGGFIFLLFGKIPGFGRFWGDIYWRKGNFTFYFPLASSILVSLLLTLILNLFIRK